MSGIGIKEIGVYVPQEGIDAFELGARLEADPQFIRQKLGFETLPRKRSDQQCSDLCVKAFEDLCTRVEIDISTVDCVVVVTQNPDGAGIPHASAVVHYALGMRKTAPCFDISLGCTGYVHALSILSGFLDQNSMRTGLLFTADPYSRVIDMDDRNTAMLFGDAATCTLVCDRPRYRFGKTNYLTAGRHSHAIQICSESHRLRMDGNLVFRFVAKNVPKQIRECVNRNGYQMDDINLFLVHQGSRFIVDTLAKSLDLPAEKMPFRAAETGNTVSSSIPLLLYDLLEAEAAPERILLAAFGVGLSSATTVINSEAT